MIQRVIFLLGFVISGAIAAPEPVYEYGSEYAIWIHSAPTQLKCEKLAELIKDVVKSPKDRLKVVLEAGAKGPGADRPGTSPSRVEVSFEGSAQVTAGALKVRIPSPENKPGTKETKPVRHTSRLRQLVHGAPDIDYVQGTILPRTGAGVSLAPVEEGVRTRDDSNPLGALLQCHPQMALVEIDINLPGYRVIASTRKKTELDSAGVKLDHVFSWDIVIASRSWKRVKGGVGAAPAKWLPAWKKGSKNSGWLIPQPAKKRAEQTPEDLTQEEK